MSVRRFTDKGLRLLHTKASRTLHSARTKQRRSHSPIARIAGLFPRLFLIVPPPPVTTQQAQTAPAPTPTTPFRLFHANSGTVSPDSSLRSFDCPSRPPRISPYTFKSTSLAFHARGVQRQHRAANSSHLDFLSAPTPFLPHTRIDEYFTEFKHIWYIHHYNILRVHKVHVLFTISALLPSPISRASSQGKLRCKAVR